MPKDSTISLRLPGDLALALERAAAEQGRPKSELVRAAVAAYLTPSQSRSEVRPMPASEFARAWATAPHLTSNEAAALKSDLGDARAVIPPLGDPWA